MSWTVSFVNAAAEAELNALPLDMRTRFLRFADLFRERGVAAMREPWAKHLTGKLWELRLTGRDGIALDLRDRGPPAGGGAQDVRQEDAENAAAGN